MRKAALVLVLVEPPGITDPTESNFAQPVRSNGVVEFPLITDAPAAKYPKARTSSRRTSRRRITRARSTARR